MTQFAYFKGPKPEFGEYEFVRLSGDEIRRCWGDSVSDEEANSSWVVSSEYDDIAIDQLTMAVPNFESFDNFFSSDLFKLISGYIDVCESITFAYCCDTYDVTTYTSKFKFIAAVLDQSLNNGGMVYARYERSS